MRVVSARRQTATAGVNVGRAAYMGGMPDANAHAARVAADGGANVDRATATTAAQLGLTYPLSLAWAAGLGSKTGKLYSLRPTNGSGDLVVTGSMPTISGGVMTVTSSHNVALPSSGFGEVRTWIVNNAAMTHPAGRDMNGYRLPPNTYTRIMASEQVLTAEQLAALGVTTVYNDAWVVVVEGNPTNPDTPTTGTMTFSAAGNLDVYHLGDATGTVTRSNDVVWQSVQLRRHDVTVNCPNGGRGEIVVVGGASVRSLGNHNGASNPSVHYYNGTDTSIPRIRLMLNDISDNVGKIRIADNNSSLTAFGNKALPTGLTYIYWLNLPNINWSYNGALPTGLTYIYWNNLPNINWSYDGALPTGLTYIYWNNLPNINWSYDGALPTGLTYISWRDLPNINWSYNDALPTGLTYINWDNLPNINWSYNGALPTGLTYIYWSNLPNINWSYNGALPTGLTYIFWDNLPTLNWTYNGALPTGLTYIFWRSLPNINWTGNILGNPSTPKPNLNLYYGMLDFRVNPMDYTDLLSILDCLVNNVGTLSSRVILGEQIPDNVTAIAAATPNETGTPAEQAKFKINWIKTNKGVTTFRLNTANI